MNEYRQNLLKEIGIFKDELVLAYTDWYVISCSGKLSEEFMKEFNEEIHWGDLFSHQVLSNYFLIEIQNVINWTAYFTNANSSFFIMKKFIFKANPYFFQHFNISHFNEQQINELQRIIDLKNVFRKDEIKLKKTI